MKWIGQNIWDKISRFRDHTYFEESITLSTGKSITMDEYTSGTISITKIQDSGTTFNDNDTSLMTAAAIADKIEAYGYSTTAGDITGVTAGTNLSGGGASGAVTINLADASTSAKGAASFTSEFFAVSSGAVSLNDAMTWENTVVTTDKLTLTSANSTDPFFIIQNTTDDNRGATLKLNKNRGADAQDNDVIGNILFSGYDDGTPSVQDYGSIICSVADATSGQEAGNLKLYAASYDGVLTEGLQLLGDTNADGEVDVTIAAGAASTTTIAGTLTMGSTAAMTNAGLVSVANQSNITGLGTITSGVWTGTSIATGYTDAKVTAVNAGDGIDVDTTTGSVTVTAETASATNPGVVELATTAEADSGTDTARAITAAGLKSHVDARYHYQYINMLGNATVPSDGDWMTVSGNGVSNHTWNTNLGSGGVTVGSSTVTIPLAAIGAGIRIPYAAVLVGFTGIFLRASNHQPAFGLFLGEPTWNDYATFDCTLRAYDVADYSAGPDSNYSSRPIKCEDLTRSQAITAGQVIYPAIKDLGSSASVCKVSVTIVLKTLIP